MHFLIIFTFLFVAQLFGVQSACILQDVDSKQFLINEGDVEIPLSPYCSFNIVLSLIGFDTHILQDTLQPLCPFKDDYEQQYLTLNDAFPEKWRAAHNPSSWMKNSCVWFSQALSNEIGIQRFSNYISALEYGNQNITGDAGKENGLTHAWIGSSLRISPLEQVNFINRLVKKELSISAQAYAYTKAILFVEQLPNGMALYGKIEIGRAHV